MPIDTETINELLTKAEAARENAYAPYSRFRVGAALLTESGRIFTGCNIENISFGATNCAERTAVFSAVAAGERKFRAIAITAGGTAVMPCGICRQVLAEFSADMTVICADGTGGYSIFGLGELLPSGFNKFEAEDSHV